MLASCHLAAVSSHGPSQDAAGEAGAGKALLHILKHGRVAALVLALGAIAAMCARHAANRQLLTMGGAIPLVVRLVSPTAPEGCADHAVVALVHLTANDDDAKDTVEAGGGLLALAAYWAHHGGDSDLLPAHWADGGGDGDGGGESAEARAARDARRDAAARGLYELAFGHRRNDLLVTEAKRAARRGYLRWADGPEAWASGLRKYRFGSDPEATLEMEASRARVGVLMSTRVEGRA